MKHIHAVALGVLFSISANSQVGIGNTNPQATLDISASSLTTPINTDGILIPRIDEFPTPVPGASQDGMLVFVTGNGSETEGFYYWDNGSTSWIALASAGNDDDWYVIGGTSVPTDINDNVYRMGNVQVGFNNGAITSAIAASSTIGSEYSGLYNSTSGSDAGVIGYGIVNISNIGDAIRYSNIYNVNQGSHNSTHYGLENRFLNTGTGIKYGVYNTFSSAGANGYKIGIHNRFENQNSGVIGIQNSMPGAYTIAAIITGVENAIDSQGNGVHYGIRNILNGTGGGAKYGTYTDIDPTAGGQHYGIYSNVQKGSGYAGYFIGRTSFGTDPSTGRYLLPAADGSAGQVMTTDGAGNISFSDASNDADWYEELTTISPSSNASDIFTDGNVGIGVSDVQYPLHIEDPSNSTTVKIKNTSTGGGVYALNLEVNESASSSGITTGILNQITRTGQSSVASISNSYSGTDVTTGFGYLFGVDNSFGNSTSNTTLGFFNRFQGTTTTAYGFRNFVSGSFTDFYGLHNYNNPSESLSGTFYGTYNTFSGSGTGNRYGNYTNFSESGGGDKYGDYITIDSAAGGSHYGVYSDVQKGTGYAGYFIGRTSFGTDPSIGRYLLPATDGTAGQVLTTDGAGNISFQSVAGESSTASNGLTEVTNDIQLGGSLTQATTIVQGDNNLTYSLSGTGDFIIQDVGSSAPSIIVEDTGDIGIGTGTPAYPVDILENDNAVQRAVNITKTDNSSSATIGLQITKTTNGTGISAGAAVSIFGSGTGNIYGYDAYMFGTSNTTRVAFNNAFAGSDSGLKYGTRNQFIGSSTGTKYAVYNDFQTNEAGSKYGVYNTFASTSGSYNGIVNSMTGSSSQAAFGMTNTLSGTGTGAKTGVSNTFSGANGNANIYVGIDNSFGDTGNGTRWGVRNNMDGSGTGTQYGTFNDLTGTGTGTKYGSYNYVDSGAGGTHYGVYSQVSNANGWAGYFAGKNYISQALGINNPSPNGRLDIIHNSTGSASPHIMLTASNADTGTRITLDNEVETNNNWVLYGRADNTLADSRFNLFHTTTGNIISALGNGDVGIKGTPDIDFHLYHGNNGTADGMKLQNTNDNTWWRLYVSSGSDDLRLYNSNNGTTIMGAFDDVTGAYSSTSDRRLKKDFKELYFSWENFMQLQPLTYKYKIDPDQNSYIGMVAQDVEKIYPELINYEEEEDIYHLDYGTTGVVAIKAVQELKKQVDNLQKENENLKELLKKYETIEARLSALEGKTNSQNTMQAMNSDK